MVKAVNVSLFGSMLSLHDVRQVAWSNRAASTAMGKLLVHSKHRVRAQASLTALNTSF